MSAFRRIVSSYWTALALGVVALALHVRWYVVDKAPGAEVVSGFGAVVVAITITAIGASLLLPGALDRATAGAAPQDFRMFWHKHDPEAGSKRDALLAEVRLEIIVERLVIGGAVLIGTLLNGYGALVARLLGLRL